MILGYSFIYSNSSNIQVGTYHYVQLYDYNYLHLTNGGRKKNDVSSNHGNDKIFFKFSTLQN